jgi:hypothetical protein
MPRCFAWLQGKGKGCASAGKAEFDACSAPGDPFFWGGKAGRDSVPDWMRLIL